LDFSFERGIEVNYRHLNPFYLLACLIAYLVEGFIGMLFVRYGEILEGEPPNRQ